MTITADGKRRLAIWIAKTIMTGEFIQPSQVSITQEERELFRTTEEPGVHWSIWMVPYTAGKWSQCAMFHHAIGLYPPPEPMRHGVKNTHWTVIGIGRVIFFAGGTTSKGATFSFQDEVRNNFTRLWPPDGLPVAWPTMLHVTDRGADELARQFSNWLGIAAPMML